MSVMRYTTEAEVGYDYFDPDGQPIKGFITKAVPKDGDPLFADAIRALVLKETNRTYGFPDVLMTTRAHWSGYSEYTITNQWSEIILTVVAWNWEREWPSLGDFLRALADANPEADRY